MEPARRAATPDQPVTAPLAAFASGLRFEDLPAEARAVARHTLLDVIGVSVAAISEPLCRMLAEQIRDEGGAPHAGLIGAGGRTSASQAALYNGAAGHALDYDDVLGVMTGHPTVPVWPAVLALAERHGLDGRAAVAAFCAGVEIEGRLGALMGPGHYARGWHATGTIGTFGAAAAAANLLKLDAEATALALGIAGTQAAGLKAMFGTMCKPLHAGKAAQNGLLAAVLASRGFSSRPDVLDCAQGFVSTQADGVNAAAALEGIGSRWHTPDVLFKYHAACYGTHAPIEAAMKARRHPAFALDAVRRIDVEIAGHCFGMCDIVDPVTGLEAKFSLAHNVGLGLTGAADGSLGLYDDARVAAAADVARLRPLVHLSTSETIGAFEARLVVHLADGVVIRETHDCELPERDLDRQWQKLSAKFRALAEPALGSDKAARVIAAVEGLEEADSLGELVAATAV